MNIKTLFFLSICAAASHSITSPIYAQDVAPLVLNPERMVYYHTPIEVGKEFGINLPVAWQWHDKPLEPVVSEPASVVIIKPKPGQTCRALNATTDNVGNFPVECKSDTPGDFLIAVKVREWTSSETSLQIVDPKATPKPSPKPTPLPSPKSTPTVLPTPANTPSYIPEETPPTSPSPTVTSSQATHPFFQSFIWAISLGVITLTGIVLYARYSTHRSFFSRE
jgi:hypothetical protein